MAKAKLGDLSTGLDAARVVNWRLGLMHQAVLRPSVSTAVEMMRMVTEKQTAFAMGMLGAQQAMVMAWLQGAREVGKVANQVAEAAQAPALKTLNSNVRRVSHRRRR